MPFPREFPSDAASKIGRAILTRDVDPQLLEPAYDLAGYGCYQLGFAAEDDVPPPARAALAYTGPADVESLGRILSQVGDDQSGRAAARSAESSGDFTSAAPAEAVPWGLIVPIVWKLIERILDKAA